MYSLLPAQSPFPEELHFSWCYELIGNKTFRGNNVEQCGDSLKQLRCALCLTLS